SLGHTTREYLFRNLFIIDLPSSILYTYTITIGRTNNLNLKVDEEEETQEDEYIYTPDYYVPTDEETNDENKEFDDEELDELYKDVNVRSKVTEHKEVGKGNAKVTDATHESASQEKSYEQVIKDAHMTLTSSQKTEGSEQSSSVSSDFASKFLNLDNVPPVVDEVASMMNVKVPHEESSTQAPPILSVPMTAIPETSTIPATTIFLPYSDLIREFLPWKKSLLNLKKIRFATQTALQSYTTEFEKKAQEEKDRYIDLVEKSIKDIIKDEVKSQLPQILPKEVSDFATPMIQSAINESLKNVILAKSSSQLKSTYEAAASLTEFELKKILLYKIQKSKSYRGAPEHRQLYDALIKSCKLDKDLFESYGNIYSLKRDCDDKDQDEDPPAGSDQGLKKWKTSKDAEPPKGSKSKYSTSSSSKGTKSQPKSSSKSVQAEELVFKVADTEMSQDQGGDLGNKEDQPSVKTGPKHDCRIAQTEKPPLIFDELMSTHVDFSTYVMNNLKIDNLTQEILKKLLNLERDVIFDFGVALRMFTRRIIILKRVEDLQLGVESYQKKLNITKPETYRSDISNLTPYTAYNNPQGIIYLDKSKRNRTVLHNIAKNPRMKYIPKRRWSNLDRKRSRIMIKAIDQQLFERRLMRNLEKFVRGREYRNDFRLLERTI
ncbi:hypothetical protein Tco_0846505, partial [Tanacetum coccineum]